MHLIYQALQQTGGKTDADAMVAAMKGMKWESPRGPISIDPRTRDIVQNIYIRKVEKVNGEPWAIEFATFEAVKDPLRWPIPTSRRSCKGRVICSPIRCSCSCRPDRQDLRPTVRGARARQIGAQAHRSRRHCG